MPDDRKPRTAGQRATAVRNALRDVPRGHGLRVDDDVRHYRGHFHAIEDETLVLRGRDAIALRIPLASIQRVERVGHRARQGAALAASIALLVALWVVNFYSNAAGSGAGSLILVFVAVAAGMVLIAAGCGAVIGMAFDRTDLLFASKPTSSHA